MVVMVEALGVSAGLVYQKQAPYSRCLEKAIKRNMDFYTTTKTADSLLDGWELGLMGSVGRLENALEKGFPMAWNDLANRRIVLERGTRRCFHCLLIKDLVKQYRRRRRRLLCSEEKHRR